MEKHTKKLYKKKTVRGKKQVHKDSMYIELKSIYLISRVGIINATCKDGYKIFIERQGKKSVHYYTQLFYTFKNRKDYMDALEYIEKKGYRWIINNQFSEEYFWNIKQDMK